MSLKSKAVTGMKWTGLSTVVVSVLQFLKISVLGRLLGPEAFGLMGMAMVVIGLAQAFGDMGISNAIICRQDATKKQLSSLYWLNFIAGFIVFVILMLSIPFIVNFYNEPRLEILIRWTALMFLIMPAGQQFQLLMQKSLQFDKITKITIAGAFSEIIIALSFALTGFGVLSIVWGYLAGTFCRSLLFMLAGWREWKPMFVFDTSDLKGYLSFGLYQMGERLTNFFGSNIDYIIIGKFLGAVPLGYYTIAYQLVVIPQTKINPIINNVMFPVFSQIQNDNDRIKRGYLKVINMVSFLGFPLLVGLGVTAPLLVNVVWGQEWLTSIGLIQILVIMGMLRAIGNPIGSVLLAKGRADIGFYLNITVAIIKTGLFLYLVKFGVPAIAAGHAITSLILIPVGLQILKKLLGMKPNIYFSALRTPLLTSLLMGVSVWLFGILAGRFIDEKVIILTGQIIVGIVTYAGLYHVFEAGFVIEFFSMFMNKKRKSIAQESEN
jgi:O-antigen/teichoic acid export membrane protein